MFGILTAPIPALVASILFFDLGGGASSGAGRAARRQPRPRRLRRRQAGRRAPAGRQDLPRDHRSRALRAPRERAAAGVRARADPRPGAQPLVLRDRRRRLALDRPARLDRRAVAKLGGAGGDLGGRSSTASAPATTSSSRTSSRGFVQIAYFGLLPGYFGLGIGGHALTAAIRRGFELAPRVTVSTATSDGPHALANYEARGMRVVASRAAAGSTARGPETAARNALPLASAAERERTAVVYQVYPRSFQDSDGDGVGDLAGVDRAPRPPRVARRRRALALADLPSPGADAGYDVADYTAVDPAYGTLDDFDAPGRGLPRARDRACWLDLVASHTSIEHPWFREHPDRYVWADGDGRRTTGAPPSAGRPGAATPHGRALVPALVLSRAARPRLAQPRGRARRSSTVVAVLARARGRRLPPRRDRAGDEGPRAARRPARERPAGAAGCPRRRRGSTRCTRATTPRSRPCSRPCARRPATRSWSARSTCRRAGSAPYLEHLDLAFAFEFLHAPWEAERLRAVIAEAARGRAASPGCSRTTTSRGSPTRLGPDAVRAAAILLLTLPGAGVRLPGRRDRDGRRRRGRAAGRPLRPRPPPPPDAVGRRAPRAASAPASRGCAPTDPEARNVADQRADPDSVAQPLPRADRAAAPSSTAGWRCSTPARGWSPTAAATTRSRSTSGPNRRRSRAPASCVIGADRARRSARTIPPNGGLRHAGGLNACYAGN